MSQPCGTPKCERISRGLCDCCTQNLCLQHLSEHNTLLVLELNPLTDEINTLGGRLKSLNIHEVVSDGRRKLENWRKECHEKIDNFFEKKCQELNHLFDDKLDRQQKEILRIQAKLTKLVDEKEATRQDIDLVTSRIRQLESEMKKIEETNVQVITHSLQIDDHLVQIQDMNENELNLSTICPVYRTLTSPKGSYIVLTSNDQFLLIHQEPNLCLVDKEMHVVKKVLWKYDVILDMCWSSSMNRFVILEENDISLVDEKTMSIQNIETIVKQNWLSCTCSDTSLFLSTNVRGSSVVELRLLPSVAIIKEWKSPVTCLKDEYINGIVCKSRTCAIVIENNVQKSIRIELRSCQTLERIWSLPLDIKINQNLLFRCCSLTCNEWLMVDYETKRLLHITKDGQLKKIIPYNGIPRRAILFASDMIVVQANKEINLHKV